MENAKPKWMASLWLITIKERLGDASRLLPIRHNTHFGGISHMLKKKKMASNAIQQGISFCVALQCVIKRHTFQGNRVLYHRETVANHLPSGRISTVGNRVWWVLDWVWWLKSFAHITFLSPSSPFKPTSHGSGWQSSHQKRHKFIPPA